MTTQAFEMTETARFSMGFYFQAFIRMLGAPGEFFSQFPEKVGFQQPLGFLILSSLFFTGASLTCLRESHVVMAGILLMNAVSMTFVAACTGFFVMAMTIGKRTTFVKFFAVYAFSAGVTMLASWIPLFVWLTEPWKWLLIAMGMVKGCGLRWSQALLIIGLSIFVVVLFFWSLPPVISYLKGSA
jgi:hypothetical protein